MENEHANSWRNRWGLGWMCRFFDRVCASRREIELRLRKLELAIEQSPTTIVITDKDGNIEYANPKFTQITGYTVAEVRGKNPRILKSGRHTQFEYEELWQTILSGREWRGEFYNKKKNGEFYWESAVIAPLLDPAGMVTHFVAVKEDITLQKCTQESLRKSEEQLRLLLNSAAEGIYGVDLHGTCTFCNPAAVRCLGYHNASDLLGKNMHWLCHHSRADGSQYPIEECRAYVKIAQGLGEYVDDEVFWRADGTPFPVEYWAYPQFSGDQLVGGVVTFFDITARKTIEEAARRRGVVSRKRQARGNDLQHGGRRCLRGCEQCYRRGQRLPVPIRGRRTRRHPRQSH